MSIRDEAQELIEQNERLIEQLRKGRDEELDLDKMIAEAGLPQDDLRVRNLYNQRFESRKEVNDAILNVARSIAYNVPRDADRASYVAKVARPDKQAEFRGEYQRRLDEIVQKAANGEISHQHKVSLIANMKRDMRHRGMEIG